MSKEIIPIERIAQKIHLFRGQKVMRDFDLAQLYGVTTGNLNKAVNRNRDRFPSDFAFQLTAEEAQRLIFQIGRSKGRGGHRRRPHAFTEQGVAMLSSVLNSERAVGERTRLACRRWRPRHRELVLHSGSLALGIDLGAFRRGRRKEHARRVCSPKPRREIGFHVREKAARYRTRKVSIRHA